MICLPMEYICFAVCHMPGIYRRDAHVSWPHAMQVLGFFFHRRTSTTIFVQEQVSYSFPELDPCSNGAWQSLCFVAMPSALSNGARAWLTSTFIWALTPGRY